jgi:hypothetical protein
MAVYNKYNKVRRNNVGLSSPQLRDREPRSTAVRQAHWQSGNHPPYLMTTSGSLLKLVDKQELPS